MIIGDMRARDVQVVVVDCFIEWSFRAAVRWTRGRW